MSLLQISKAILSRRAALAEALVRREFAQRPELAERYGPAGRKKCLQDAGYHLAYLAQAVAAESPALFADYIGWAKVMLARRRVPVSDLAAHLKTMGEVFAELPEFRSPAVPIIEYALERFSDFPEELPSFIHPGPPHSLLAHQYLQALLRGERHRASRLILQAVEAGATVQDIYLHVFQRTQYEIGRLWQINEINAAQEHYCTAVTQLVMSQLYPRIFTTEKRHGAFVGTGVSGDLHEIGMRMVADFFEMAGWNTYYLGANTPTASVVQAVAERRASLLGISATITYHVPEVEALVREIRAHPACTEVKILVGGYPFNVAPDLWRKLGADGSARDAASAVALAERLSNDHRRN